MYAVFRYKSGEVSSRLVAAKTRVAPLASTSIPRMELMAAVLAIRVTKYAVETYDIKASLVEYWTDSQNVLWWIHGRSRRYKAFVGNRVSKIQTQSNPVQWHYVPTKFNPADLLTHGMQIDDLVNSHMWWHRPDFIKQEKQCWPAKEMSKPAAVEERPQHVTYLVAKTKDGTSVKENDKLDPDRFSSWPRLVRVFAWVKKFINKCRKANIHGKLSPSETKIAQIHFIRQAQMDDFTTEYALLSKQQAVAAKSPISCLLPTMDDEGLTRGNTRIRNADFLPFNVRYPVILPRHHRVTKLIVQHMDDDHSAGTNHALSKIVCEILDYCSKRVD